MPNYWHGFQDKRFLPDACWQQQEWFISLHSSDWQGTQTERVVIMLCINMHGSFVIVLGLFFFPCWSLKKPCKASKSKHIFNDSYHDYLTIKLFFYVGLSCIICESTDVQVSPVKDSQKTRRLMEIQILEKGQKQPHYQPVIWACSPKRCYQPWNGSCWEKQDQSNPFSGFCVYHAFKLRLRPRVVMETAAAGGEGKKKRRLDCCWTWWDAWV